MDDEPGSGWSPRLERAVERTAPGVPEPTEAELAGLWSQVRAGTDLGNGVRRPRRRPAGIPVAALVAVVVLATSGVAGARLITAHTGRQPSDTEDVRLGGPGERLDPAAPDFGTVATEETATIPFPSAASRRIAIDDQVADGRRSPPGETLVSVGALRAWVADAAVCAWSNQWAAATRDGDEPARGAAMARLRQAPRWPAVVAIDPRPHGRTTRVEVTDPDGDTHLESARDDTPFFYLAELGRLVDGRDPAPVARLLAANNGYCSPGLVPDLPAADPLSGRGR